MLPSTLMFCAPWLASVSPAPAWTWSSSVSVTASPVAAVLPTLSPSPAAAVIVVAAVPLSSELATVSERVVAVSDSALSVVLKV